MNKGNKAGPMFQVYADIGMFTTYRPGVVGSLKGLALEGLADYAGNGTFTRHMQSGVSKNVADGNPAQPSIQLATPGFWRFRWIVQAGARSVQASVKQADNRTPYPSIIIKANAEVGLNADVTATSPGGAGWVTVGPASFVATALGVVWVELWNNTTYSAAPCLFDHIIVL